MSFMQKHGAQSTQRPGLFDRTFNSGHGAASIKASIQREASGYADLAS